VLAAIQWSQIFEVIWVSLLMGVGVTALFAIIIHASSRAAECRRTGQGTALVYGVVAAIALAAFGAAVVFGITVILQKS
jgi:hypothetical protein